MFSADLDNFVEAIHATPPMVVIEFAGAGAQALAWLHGVGGSSRTVLEATDRYAAASVAEGAGFAPEQFTSSKVARALATNAYIRAAHLTGHGPPVAGIGCTAAIATDRAKRGQHRCCVAVSSAQGVITYSLILEKGARTRHEEEQLISRLILNAVARVCGLETRLPLRLLANENLEERVEPVGLLERLLARELELVIAWPDGQLTPGRQLSHIAVLSGSFNPLHKGHRKMARTVAELLNKKVYFELPLINAEKTAIDPAEAHLRVSQFTGYAPVLLTTAPLFSQKAQIFPHSEFILGADTAQRLIQPRFYNDDPNQMLASLRQIRVAGCRFLVAGRLQNDHFLTLKDLSLPGGYTELFTEIPEAEFRQDISSTTLRKQGVTP